MAAPTINDVHEIATSAQETAARALEKARRAEQIADGAVNHALEAIGALTREVSSTRGSIIKLERGLEHLRSDIGARFDQILRRISDRVRQGMESVPDLVKDEVTGQHDRAELERIRWWKALVRKLFTDATVKIVKGAGYAIGAGLGGALLMHLAHRIGWFGGIAPLK